MVFERPTPALKTSPWRRRTQDGVYYGHNNTLVAYWELPLAPLKWEDGRERLAAGTDLNQLLSALGQTSVDVANGLAALAVKRRIHLFAASYTQYIAPPKNTSETHQDLLARILPAQATGKTLLIGVVLWNQVKRSLAQGGAAGGSGTIGQFWKQTKTVLSRDVDSEDSFKPYQADYSHIDDIMRRGGAKKPSLQALNQLESWFNNGNGPDCQVLATPTDFTVPNVGTWEISAIVEFTNPKMSAPADAWLMDAMSGKDPASVVSIKAELLPATVLRAQLRQSQRKLVAQEEEEIKTGDITRDEIGAISNLAKELENTVQAEGVAWLSDASILMARKVNLYDDSTGDYRDVLRNSYGIDSKPLEHRQRAALAEMNPCGDKANPFDQVLSIPLVAYGGLSAFSNIGDKGPLWLGEVDPDGVPTFIDPKAAPGGDKPPIMAVLGDPGSGKASAVEEPVLTPAGWKPMGDIKVGDRIIGRDGGTHLVQGVYPQGVVDLFKVRFSDGSFTEVTADHLWAVAASSRQAADERWQVKTTSQLKETLLDGQGKRRWRIPMISPAQHPKAEQTVDGYVLGNLIAASKGKKLLRMKFDPANAGLVQQLLPADVGLKQTPNGSFEVTPTQQFTNTLAILGVWDASVGLVRHIPDNYLVASAEQRWQLLQGLMDGGGRVSGKNETHFYTTCDSLQTQLLQLVQSFGGTAKCVSKTNSENTLHCLTLCLPNQLGSPFRFGEAKNVWQPRTKYVPCRTVAEVTFSRKGHAQCISVSAADNLYVTRSHIVTHNTYAAQLLAGQAALSGTQTMFINPKGFSSLAPFANWVAEFGINSTRVSLAALEKESGAFDPFRFADPVMAAEILNRHITTVMGVSYNGGLTGDQEVELAAGLVRGAEAGARCAYDALQYVEDKGVVTSVIKQAEGSSLFRLGFGFQEQEPYGSGNKGLTLIEFDRALPLPNPGTVPERDERIAVGAMRLVTRASLEILLKSGGGVLVVDEAHHYLNSTEGLASLQRLGREGRSLGLMPIFLTQRVADLVDADMENYLSRVLLMKLTDERDAVNGLRLCGLEPTRSRVELLRDAGPRRPSIDSPGRPAVGFFRDIDDRHALVAVGPGLPEDIRLAFSTNPDDIQKREELLEQIASRNVKPRKPLS